MTCIAYDGRVLAADKQSTYGGHGSTVTKLGRVPDGMAAVCGDAGIARALLVWAQGGRDPEQFPPEAAEAKGEDEGAQMLVIDAKGTIMLYQKSIYPEIIEDRFTAMGCGHDYAMAAMHLGFDAKTAVQVACDLDVHCGKGIDTLELP